MNSYVIDYNKVKHPVDIDISKVESVSVVHSYGDEIVTFFFKDGTAATIDAGDFIGGRYLEERVGSYTVTGTENLLKWNRRKDPR